VAGVRRVKGRITTFVSRAFVESLSDRELVALLAHEVITSPVATSKRPDVEQSWAPLAISRWPSGSPFDIKIAIVAALPILTTALLVGLMMTNILLSPLNRWREGRADREGAQLSGEPPAPAQALVAEAGSREMRLRLYGRTRWSWLLAPVSWRLPTHPPMARRIARLESMV
jgi:Zn-dependent protease with chaperone function